MTHVNRKLFSTPIPQEASKLKLRIVSDIIDRWEGLSATYEVWGSAPSARYLSTTLVNDDDRQRVANYFLRREFARDFERLVPTFTVKPEDCMISKNDLHAQLITTLNPNQAGIVMELILPALLAKGTVVGNLKYSVHKRYGFDRVIDRDIHRDVAVYQVLQTVKETSASAIDVKVKYSTKVLAEMWAEVFRPIGQQLFDVNDLSVVVDDMIKGVRVNLDPTMSSGLLTGSVPSHWRKHAVVEELSTNMVFVRAALALGPTSDVTPSCEGWKLEKWAPVILAAIKSSERYAWVGKAEVLRTFGCTRIRDVKGQVRSAVLYRYAKVQALAQAVFGVDDALAIGAYNISATRDRVAEAVQSAYGSSTFSTVPVAELVASLVRDGIEAGWRKPKDLYVIDLVNEAAVSLHTVACMLANTLYVAIDDNGIQIEDTYIITDDGEGGEKVTRKADLNDEEIERTWNPRWWYQVGTTELNLDILSGRHSGSEIETSDPVEVLWAHADFEPLEAVAPKPQILGPAAFNTRVVAFDKSLLYKMSQRYSFNFDVNGIPMRGAFKPSSFASMKTDPYTALVTPHFNEAVVRGTEAAYELAQSVIADQQESGEDEWRNAAPSSEFFNLLNRRVAMSLLKLAQQLAPGFRDEVQSSITDRTVSGATTLNYEDSLILRSTLAQRTFAACADVVALQFFLAMQGFQTKGFDDMFFTPAMMRTYLEIGSDRTPD